MNIDKTILDSITIKPLINTLKLEKISDDEYFSEYYKDRLSNSRISLLKTKGAKTFFEGIKNEYNTSFDFGTNFHALVLEPEEYELIDSVIKPSAKAGLMADFLYNDSGKFPSDDEIKIASIKCNYYKDKLTFNRILEFKEKAEPYWRDRFIFEQKSPKSAKKRIFTDKKSIDLLKSCLNSVLNNPQIIDILNPQGLINTPYIANETSILIDFELSIPDRDPVIYKWKSKLDNFNIDFEENTITVNDLKTTSRLIKDFDLTYYSYHRELAIYSYLLKLCAKKFFELENPSIKGNFLVVSTVPDYKSTIIPMTPKLFKQGFEEFKYLLKCIFYLNVIKGYEFVI